MADLVEDLKEVARAILGNERPTDGADVSAPLGTEVPGIGGAYQGEDLSDELGHASQPEVIERALAVPGPVDDPTMPFLDATEYEIEHAKARRPQRLDTGGDERRPPREVVAVGGDIITVQRIGVPAAGASNDPVLRFDRKRLRYRIRVVTASKTVYVGFSQAGASEANGWPLATADAPLVLESTGELWIRTAAAEAAPVDVALLVETRNMPATL